MKRCIIVYLWFIEGVFLKVYLDSDLNLFVCISHSSSGDDDEKPDDKLF